MPTEQVDTVAIPNAAWWAPHSFVICKEDMLAEDEAWIQNRLSKIQGYGSNKPSMEMMVGNIRILTIQRMVTSGLVAVTRGSGRIKTVNLPHEAGKLLKSDLDYIFGEIDKLNPDMTEEQQTDFLPSANGHLTTSLELVRPSQESS